MPVISTVKRFFAEMPLSTVFAADNQPIESRINTFRESAKKLTDFVSIYTQAVFVNIFYRIALKSSAASSGTIRQYIFVACAAGSFAILCMLWLRGGQITFYYLLKILGHSESKPWRMVFVALCIFYYVMISLGVNAVSGTLVDAALTGYNKPKLEQEYF